MTDPRIDGASLLARLERIGEVGALSGGGVRRLALTEEDRAGRDLLVAWMRELGLAVSIDAIGNIVGVRAGAEDGPPVMIGSHIDTVATGGLYDGALGVLAGLEVAAALDGAGLLTRRSLAVAAFTNEEGARFAPDMMGSAVHQGALSLSEARAARGIDGATAGEALDRIGYAGDVACPGPTPAGYLELHIEQGPVLERAGARIGAVTGVQGISWTEVVFEGRAAHAGTTPTAARRDAGLAAARLAVAAREIADEVGPPQVATVGALALAPGLVNVVAERATLTVDLRHPEEAALRAAEARLQEAAERIAAAEGCGLALKRLARFAPVAFDPELVARVERAAEARGLPVLRLHSGAGHDAQMFAPNCPTAMIFTPSAEGLSHNVAEFTAPDDLVAGAEVLLDVALDLLEPLA